jgi:tetratricopeptide (TPR) repeat protein
MRITVKAVAVALICLVCVARLPAQAAASRAGDPLQAGIDAFRLGDFTKALSEFLHAEREGLDTPALHYNLGSTYYKLGRNADAETEFRSLLSDPKFGDFARYNLGLIARRTGRSAEAHAHFAAVAEQAKTLPLRGLARAELGGHPSGSSGRRRSAWQGSLEAGAGYDDNVTLAARTALITPSGAGSPTYSVLGSAGGPLAGNGRRGLRLTGSVYDIKYPHQSDYDLLVSRAGPSYRFELDSWRVQTGLYATYIRLGANTLETLGALNLRGEHALGAGRLTLDYSLQRMGGGPRYDYLTGWQNRFGVHGSWHPGPTWITIGYALVLNNRRDLVSGAQFFSVSPMRALECDFQDDVLRPCCVLAKPLP